MDTQMVKLLKIIRKAKEQAVYHELRQNPLYEKSLLSCKSLVTLQLARLIVTANLFLKPKFISLQKGNFLLDQRALTVKENIQRIFVPIVIGVLSYISSKLIDLWLF